MQTRQNVLHQWLEHIHYFMKNFAKAFLSAFTAGAFIKAPKSKLKREYQRLARLSHAFAWLSDFSLIYLGGQLKRKERLSARLADGMSYLYLAMAALRFYELNPNNVYRIHAKWATSYCFYHAQKSLINLCQNFPSRFLGLFMRLWAFPFGQTMSLPSDRLDRQLAQLMTNNNEYRDILLGSIYLSGNKKQPIDRVESAFQLLIEHEELYKKVADLRRVPLGQLKEKLLEKVNANLLSKEEANIILTIEKARWDAILVDEFAFADMKKGKFNSVTDEIPTPFDEVSRESAFLL